MTSTGKVHRLTARDQSFGEMLDDLQETHDRLGVRGFMLVAELGDGTVLTISHGGGDSSPFVLLGAIEASKLAVLENLDDVECE